LYAVEELSARIGPFPVTKGATMTGWLTRNTQMQPDRAGHPRNRRLPAVYRILARDAGEAVALGELARDAQLALVEATLFAADEPLSPRRLATVAGLADAADARRLVRKLQSLYDKDGT